LIVSDADIVMGSVYGVVELEGVVPFMV